LGEGRFLNTVTDATPIKTNGAGGGYTRLEQSGG